MEWNLWISLRYFDKTDVEFFTLSLMEDILCVAWEQQSNRMHLFIYDSPIDEVVYVFGRNVNAQRNIHKYG